MWTGSRAPSFVKSEFGANDRGLLKALSERFTVRTFRFSSAATRTTQESDLTFGGSQSRLGAALSGVRQELAGLPVAGPGDGERRRRHRRCGARRSASSASRPRACRSSPIGVGRETLSKDIQVGRVVTPKTALKGTTLMVDVVLSQSGFDGQKVTLDVEDEGTLVSTQQVSLPDAGTPASIPVRFTVNEAGPRVLRFRVSPQAGRARHREQRARSADRRARSQGEDSLLRRRAALRIQVHPPRHPRRRQPHRHQPDPHRRQQVHAAGRRWPRRAGRGVSEDARRAVRLSVARSSAASKPPRSPAISCR